MGAGFSGEFDWNLRDKRAKPVALGRIVWKGTKEGVHTMKSKLDLLEEVVLTLLPKNLLL